MSQFCRNSSRQRSGFKTLRLHNGFPASTVSGRLAVGFFMPDTPPETARRHWGWGTPLPRGTLLDYIARNIDNPMAH